VARQSEAVRSEAQEATAMDEDVRRRLLKGLLGLVFGIAATWLATYITDLVLGPEEQS
jgi:hypothetical protein